MAQAKVRRSEVVDQQVEGELEGKVEEVPPCELLRPDKTWSEGVEEDLEGAV